MPVQDAPRVAPQKPINDVRGDIGPHHLDTAQSPSPCLERLSPKLRRKSDSPQKKYERGMAEQRTTCATKHTPHRRRASASRIMNHDRGSAARESSDPPHPEWGDRGRPGDVGTF